MWEEIVNKLADNNMTIATMESCTGGGIANEITNISGASEVFKEGYVSYSNEAKIKFGVSKKVIDKYTVYSSETAIEMAKVAKLKATSNLAIGITGQLGRLDPANPNAKVNHVWYAIINDANELFVEEMIVENTTRDKQKKAIIDKVGKSIFTYI